MAAATACPAGRSTDQRQDTIRVSHKQGSDRAGQGYPILAGSGKNRLTVVAVALGPDRGDGLGFGDPLGVANRSILHAPIAVMGQLQAAGAGAEASGLHQTSVPDVERETVRLVHGFEA